MSDLLMEPRTYLEFMSIEGQYLMEKIKHIEILKFKFQIPKLRQLQQPWTQP